MNQLEPNTDAQVVTGVSVDAAGNIYAAGAMRGNLDLDGDGSTDIPFREDFETFVLKYDSDGTLLQTMQLPGVGSSVRVEATADGVAADGIFVTGFFSGNLDFDPVPNAESFLDTSPIGRTLFLAKYDLDGNFVTARQFGSMRQDDSSFGAYDKIWSSEVDRDGLIYLTGRMHGTQEAGVDMNGDGIADIPTGTRGDAFIVKFDTDAEFQWFRYVDSDNQSGGFGVAVDDSADESSQWKAYWTGTFRGSSEIQGTSELDVLTLTPQSGDADGFVARLNADSGAAELVQTYGGTGHDYSDAVTISESGRIFVAGAFQGDIQLGSQTLSAPSSQLDGFISELDSNLVPITAHQITSDGRVGNIPFRLDFDDATNLLFVAGDYAATTTFPTGDVVNSNSNSNSTDIFLAAMDFSLGQISGEIFADLNEDGSNNDG